MRSHTALLLRFALLLFISLQGINNLANAAQENQLKGVRSWPSPDNTRVVLDLTAKPDYDIHYLTKPDRVVIDINNARSQVNLKKIVNKGPLINNVRESASGKKGTYRLVIDLNKESRAKVFTLPPAKPYGHRLVLDLPHQADANKSKPAVAENKAVAPPAVIGRDIIIAIDAGHGGDDPGALGKSTYEKKITLEISKRLQAHINRQKGMSAFLIRTGDYFVDLNKRSAIARKGKADFLVSIHADGFTSSSPRGASVWVLSNRRANTELGRWMEKHEAHSELLGGTGGLIEESSSVPFLTEMFLDMSMGNAMDVGYKVGDLVVTELKKVTKLHKGKPVHASLAVLKSPDIPSILVEAGFITNRTEERLLNQAEHQNKIASAVFQGIYKHFKESPPQGTLFAQKKRAIKHTVRSGESLSLLAQRYGVSSTSLQSYNGLKSTSLRIGQVIKIPPNYHLIIEELPVTVASTPVQKEQVHQVQRGESLSVIAAKYDSSVETLKNHNDLRSTSLRIGQKIKIPAGSAAVTTVQLVAPVVIKEQVHQVQRGESLSVIAAKYDSSVETLKNHNDLRSTSLRIGQKIKIPAGSAAVTTVQPVAPVVIKEQVHQVQRGESLSVIAAKYDSSVETLKNHNDLRSTSLRIGQKIKIPAGSVAVTTVQPVAPVVIKEQVHQVQRGESLSVIAAKYDSSVETLKNHNDLRSTSLRIGQKIKIPAGSVAVTTVQPVTPVVIKEQVHQVQRGESLSVIAAKYDSSVETLKNHNDLRSTSLRIGQKIKIPAGSVAVTTVQPVAPVAKEQIHQVQRGESLSVIAAKYDSSVETLKNHNDLRSTSLRIGQKIKIPAGSVAVTTVQPVAPVVIKEQVHQVQRGESLSVIAAKYDSSVETLKNHNDLRSTSLRIGQKIKIPTPAQAAKIASKQISTHKVQPGESLSVIAKRYGTTTQALKITNKLRSNSLKIGQVLTIPVT
ncbi:LysM peptidoglycan-binding domain-containing protein [Psychromonas sp. MME2]|uniref:LysM peptidoglycan-binding domain-containing protein n=1 Tax=unclassified Psychromonas TaxID=2614957 RepID=UPI00339D26C3